MLGTDREDGVERSHQGRIITLASALAMKPKCYRLAPRAGRTDPPHPSLFTLEGALKIVLVFLTPKQMTRIGHFLLYPGPGSHTNPGKCLTRVCPECQIVHPCPSLN